MTRLSEHFDLSELTHSAMAARKGLANIPPPAELATLTKTAQRMEQVRTLLGGKPISVLSGYRSPGVNKAVGGAAPTVDTTVTRDGLEVAATDPKPKPEPDK